MGTAHKPTPDAEAPPLVLRIADGVSKGAEYEFRRPFRIGRGDDCDVPVKDGCVSRVHAEAAFENGQWWVKDLQSANGLFIGERQVERAPVAGSADLRLGIDGPLLRFEVETPPAKESDKPLSYWIEHYLSDSAGHAIGDRTMMVRQAFQRIQKKQRGKYRWIIGALALCIAAAGGYALYLHQRMQRQQAIAQDLFYEMKSLDVSIAGVERLVRDSNSQVARDQIRELQNRRKDAEKRYNEFLTTLNVYKAKMTPQDRLVLKVTRTFGECELNVPPGFAAEIGRYISMWRSTGKLARAIRTAKEHGYAGRIAAELQDQDLPPQFFYLALQESSFDPYASGPMTRKGIAKGMWQFIPETALKYGLHVGPLANLPRPDPRDDRQDWMKATKAAVRYLKDLYSTDAQASGFLVMACYNWGEDKVLPLVQSLPKNPKERNFWKLLSKYRDKLPPETYNYVFSIASAAVIGENPRLFGFDFDNPLGQPDHQ
jgi:pSer/pThr/pTyr-binding forkhead associated (FHA) protein